MPWESGGMPPLAGTAEKDLFRSDLWRLATPGSPAWEQAWTPIQP